MKSDDEFLSHITPISMLVFVCIYLSIHLYVFVTCKELENSSGIFLDPANTEKLQASELDFLGLGPPSPKFHVRTPNTEPGR